MVRHDGLRTVAVAVSVVCVFTTIDADTKRVIVFICLYVYIYVGVIISFMYECLSSRSAGSDIHCVHTATGTQRRNRIALM